MSPIYIGSLRTEVKFDFLHRLWTIIDVELLLYMTLQIWTPFHSHLISFLNSLFILLSLIPQNLIATTSRFHRHHIVPLPPPQLHHFHFNLPLAPTPQTLKTLSQYLCKHIRFFSSSSPLSHTLQSASNNSSFHFYFIISFSILFFFVLLFVFQSHLEWFPLPAIAFATDNTKIQHLAHISTGTVCFHLWFRVCFVNYDWFEFFQFI